MQLVSEFGCPSVHQGN